MTATARIALSALSRLASLVYSSAMAGGQTSDILYSSITTTAVAMRDWATQLLTEPNATFDTRLRQLALVGAIVLSLYALQQVFSIAMKISTTVIRIGVIVAIAAGLVGFAMEGALS